MSAVIARPAAARFSAPRLPRRPAWC